jgi:hypothetical protein
MDSYERFLVPDDYEKKKLEERRSISVNELLKKKNDLGMGIMSDLHRFEMNTGIKVKSLKFDLDHGFDIQLDI